MSNFDKVQFFQLKKGQERIADKFNTMLLALAQSALDGGVNPFRLLSNEDLRHWYNNNKTNLTINIKTENECLSDVPRP